MAERFRGSSLVGVLIALVLLSGCSVNNPTVDTFLYLFPSRAQFVEVRKGIEYLVIDLDGRAALMALGGRGASSKGPFEQESWYNAQGEMLALEGGRIDRAVGMTHEWRRQVSLPPSWDRLEGAESPVAWKRTVDRMPGYRFGVEDHIVTARLEGAAPAVDGVPASARWYVDQVTSRTREGSRWDYQQRFAVLDGRVVYSEQCLAPSLCFKLKPLGLVK